MASNLLQQRSDILVQLLIAVIGCSISQTTIFLHNKRNKATPEWD
jgi:hypothetical protein